MKVQDIEFARSKDYSLLLTLYLPDRPNGHGIVMVHGGAWTANDRLSPYVLNDALAKRGMVVASLDFRCGPVFQHPTASADIAAGIRFVKSQAEEWGIARDKIGLIGSSSGGHLVLFVALQPDHEFHKTTHYIRRDEGSIQSAAVSYVIALWPVSNPLYRYHHAIDTNRPELLHAHNGYFTGVDQMHEASIQHILEVAQHSHLPPAMIVQPGEDANVPQEMTLDLLRAYQQANGSVDYRFMPGLPHGFAYQDSEATTECEGYIWDFIQQQLKQFS